MRRYTSGAARYPRKVTTPYAGGAGTVSSAGWIAGDSILIPSDTTLVLDCDTPALTSLDIQGTLIANPLRDVSITAGYINIGAAGTLQIGSESARYYKRATITLTGAESGRAARFVADITSTTGTGSGTLKRLATSTGAVVETITVTFSSATAFTVSGSVSGSLGAGTVGALFNNRIRFIATAGGTAWTNGATQVVGVVNLGFTNSGTGRSLQVQPGGKLILQGNPPAITRTRVNAHITAGQSALTMSETIGWGKKDRIVVGATDFYGTSEGTTEQLWLRTGSYGTAPTVTGTISNGKWGVMQYATDAGMSLTPGTLTDSEGVGAEWANIPKTLDQRAPVINLTRNIVIQGVDDAAWTTNRFGAHCMFMGLTSEIKVNGVEFRRMGQAGAIGRYAFHWHMLSYNMPDGFNLPSDGTFIGQANSANHYIKNCAIHQSAQRAIVVHGTHGVLVDSNVCYDITAHAIFLEDGAEKNNTITNNVVMKVRSPIAANRLLFHDGEYNASAGFWYTNPANTFSGNWASDCENVGIWNAFGTRCFGLCEDVAEVPNQTNVTTHSNNTSHSNGVLGMQTETIPASNSGMTTGVAFNPPAGFDLTDHKVWKNATGGYNNRINVGNYLGWTQADNGGLDFFGAAVGGSIQRILFIGESLNNTNSILPTTRKNAVASYHEAINPSNCVSINYPLAVPPNTALGGFGVNNPTMQGSGFINMGDLYLAGEFSFPGITKIKKINSYFGYRALPPNIDSIGVAAPYTTGPDRYRYFTFAGALRDVANNFGNGADKTYIYNHAFLTTNAANLTDEPPTGAQQGLNGKRTTTRFYGVTCSGHNIDPSQYAFQGEFNCDVLNGANAAVASWNVGPGALSWGLSNMRSFSAANGGKYKLTFGSDTPSSFVYLYVSYAKEATDLFTLGIKWSNAVPAQVWTGYDRGVPSGARISAGEARVHNSTGMTSIADVHADTTGTKFWQDTTNNLVWVRYKGGLNYPSTPTEASGAHIVVTA